MTASLGRVALTLTRPTLQLIVHRSFFELSDQKLIHTMVQTLRHGTEDSNTTSTDTHASDVYTRMHRGLRSCTSKHRGGHTQCIIKSELLRVWVFSSVLRKKHE